MIAVDQFNLDMTYYSQEDVDNNVHKVCGFRADLFCDRLSPLLDRIPGLCPNRTVEAHYTYYPDEEEILPDYAEMALVGGVPPQYNGSQVW